MDCSEWMESLLGVNRGNREYLPISQPLGHSWLPNWTITLRTKESIQWIETKGSVDAVKQCGRVNRNSQMLRDQIDPIHSQTKRREQSVIDEICSEKQTTHSILDDSFVDSPSLFAGVSSEGFEWWQWNDSRRVTLSRWRFCRAVVLPCWTTQSSRSTSLEERGTMTRSSSSPSRKIERHVFRVRRWLQRRLNESKTNDAFVKTALRWNDMKIKDRRVVFLVITLDQGSELFNALELEMVPTIVYLPESHAVDSV